MEREWLIIPDIYNLKKSVELSETYAAYFEYNDFFWPEVYSDKAEVKRRITTYKQLERDRSRDTVHGVFLDIAITSKDAQIRKYSREKVEQSLEVAEELGVRGVVFHTGLIGELQTDSYMEQWMLQQEELWRELLVKYPSVEIYMENTFEKTPEPLVRLKERLSDEERFLLCLDYGHAMLTPTPVKQWIAEVGQYIGHMHLNDNDLKADLHMVPGTGDINFDEFKKLLSDYCIQIPILLELTGAEKQKQALEYMHLL